MIAEVRTFLQRFDREESWRECVRILRSLLLSMAPAILASLWLPASACVLSVMMTVVLCYRASSSLQGQLFSLPLSTAHSLIAMPLQIVLLVWVLLLLVLHRPDLIGASVFSVLLLTMTSIAPLLRLEQSKRTQRRLPYAVTYCAAAVIVMAIQVARLWAIAK